MSRARDLADSADKDIAGTLTLDGLSVSGDVAVNTDTLFVDASADKVGIGTSSPEVPLHVNIPTTSGTNAVLQNWSTGQYQGSLKVIVDDASASNPTWKLQVNATEQIAFADTNSERMRIDSSGNLLVGTTGSNAVASSSSGSFTGVELQGNGELQIGSDGDKCAIFNRQSSDGEILRFRKDGTTVGSIGTAFSDLILYSTTASHSGLRFASNAIRPIDNTGSTADDAVDLGTTDARFQDLYLSGGVYLGGTGSANKLDDYEEGTWTPVIADAATGGHTGGGSNRYGQYTKIGNQVTIHCYYSNITTTGLTSSSVAHIRGLPFGVSSGYHSPTCTPRTDQITLASGYTWITVLGSNGNSALAIYQSKSGANDLGVAVSALSSGNADIFFTLTYQTDD